MAMMRIEELRSIAAIMAEEFPPRSKKEKKEPDGGKDNNDDGSGKKEGDDKNDNDSSARLDDKDKEGFPSNLKKTVTGKKPEKLVIYEKKDKDNDE